MSFKTETTNVKILNAKYLFNERRIFVGLNKLLFRNSIYFLSLVPGGESEVAP